MLYFCLENALILLFLLVTLVLSDFKQVFMTFEHLNEIYDKYFMIKEQTASNSHQKGVASSLYQPNLTLGWLYILLCLLHKCIERFFKFTKNINILMNYNFFLF
jgi:hypothetical protein